MRTLRRPVRITHGHRIILITVFLSGFALYPAAWGEPLPAADGTNPMESVAPGTDRPGNCAAARVPFDSDQRLGLEVQTRDRVSANSDWNAVVEFQDLPSGYQGIS